MNARDPQNARTATPLIEALAMVEASGKYRILPYVQPPVYAPTFAVNPSDHDVVAIVDCEATDGNPATAHPIEIGACKVAVVRKTGEIVAYLGSVSMLEDPGVPSEPGAQASHGIAPEDLVGQRFDDQSIRTFLEGVDYCVAHNAPYDRPVLTRRLPVFDAMPWACSMREVDWSGKGCSSRALDYLLFKAGYAHHAHRALADAEALAQLVSHAFDDGDGIGARALLELGYAARSESYQILAVGAQFDAKDAMKSRGYRWNAGDGAEGTFKVKCWASASLPSIQAKDAELDWLCENAYSKSQRATAQVLVVTATALTRHTLNQTDAALRNAASVSVAQDPGGRAMPQSLFQSPRQG